MAVDPRGSRSSAVVMSLAPARRHRSGSGAGSASRSVLLRLHDLHQPVHQLDVGVAAHLAEDGGALDRLVGDRVEFAEQGDSADLTHRNSFFRACQGQRWGGHRGLRPLRPVAARRAQRALDVDASGRRHRRCAGRRRASAVRPSIPGVAAAEPGSRRHVGARQDQLAGPTRTRCRPIAARSPAGARDRRRRQEREIARQAQRADDDAELVLHVPDRARRAPRPGRGPARRSRAAAMQARRSSRASGIQWPHHCSMRDVARRTATGTTPAGRRRRAPDARADRRSTAWHASPTRIARHAALGAEAEQRAQAAHEVGCRRAGPGSASAAPAPRRDRTAARSGASAVSRKRCSTASPCWCARSRASSVR